MARTVIVDTGALVALLSARDQHHEWAVSQANLLSLPWVTCEAVLSETYHRVNPSAKARSGLISMVRRGALMFPFAAAPSLSEILSILEKFHDLPTSVADACLLHMANQYRQSVIWSTDHDLLVYRLQNGKAPMTLLP